MLANVVDVDVGAMEVSLTQENGALFLFDFRAAFPSVAHEYIFLVLRHIGFPQAMLRFLRALYDRNKCLLSIGGSTLPGFNMSCGIRQGCPLSPLLFVTVAELLTRTLSTRVKTRFAYSAGYFH